MNAAQVLGLLSAIGSLATAVGVWITGRQLGLAQRQAVTTFEDQLAAQYRQVIRRLPIGAPLGEELSEEAHVAALPTFYHYFDLSNEQAYLAEHGRARPETWAEWRDGIEQNLRRPAFSRAWTEVSRRAPDSFDELRRVTGDTIPRAGRLAGGVAHDV